MAYSLETSSVKTIVPGAEVSGFADVVARQKISEVSSQVPILSAGDGIGIYQVDEKTLITNNISAGSNISLVYDMETNTYRIDAQGVDLTNYYTKTETSSKQEISAALQYVSANAGHTYTGINPIQVDNVNNQIGITGESLSAGPGIDLFASGGYVVISADGAGGSTFPMTATDGSRNYQMDINSSAMYITTATGAAGATTKLTTPGIQYEAYPATDMSASWRNVINAANNRSNCYCVTLNSNNTAVDLEDLSAYDRITVLHAQEYIDDDYYIRWNNNTKTVHSGEYIEMAKVNYKGNTVWTFITTGWYDDALWD
jgi:hypothetical protein